jgi:hypothetical protein
MINICRVMKSYLIKPELSQLTTLIIKSQTLKPDTSEEVATSTSRTHIMFLPLITKQKRIGNYAE